VDEDIRELAAAMSTLPQLMGRTLSQAARPMAVG
jgi:adenylosuccinate lyase